MTSRTTLRSLLAAAILTLTGIAATGNSASALQVPTDSNIFVIRGFYAEYIGEWLSDDTDFATRIQSIRERYLSSELLDALSAAELDYDPFLQAQDCDGSVLENLTVEPCDGCDKTYRIGLWDSFNDRYRTVILQIDADGRISDIELISK